MCIRRSACSRTSRAIRRTKRTRAAARILWRIRWCQCRGRYPGRARLCLHRSTGNDPVNVAVARRSQNGRGYSEGEIVVGLRVALGLCLCAWGCKARLTKPVGHAAGTTGRGQGYDELRWCGFRKRCVHGLRMCRIKRIKVDGLGVAEFGCLGMVLGGGWAGGRIGVEGWGVERSLGGIWVSVGWVYVGRAEEKKWVWLSPPW